jgi:hypothetical protein
MANFSRVFIEQVNNQKVHVLYDFAYGEYVATDNFFEKLTEIQSDMLTTGEVTLDTGITVDTSSPGGLLAIQFYMETLDARYQSMTGLAKLGLKVENQLWKNI